MNSSKIPMDTKKIKQNSREKSQTLTHPHAESNLDIDSDQTPFPKLIVNWSQQRISKLLSCLPLLLKKNS